MVKGNKNLRRTKKATRVTKSAGIMANKMMLAVIVGIVVIGAGLGAYYFMPGNDVATWNTANEIIRDRGAANPPPDTTEGGGEETETTTTEEVEPDLTPVNPIHMDLYGIDIDGIRHPIPESSGVAQSVFLGEVEIFDIEIDIFWNFENGLSLIGQALDDGADLQIIVSIVDSAVSDTYGNSFIDTSIYTFVYDVSLNIEEDPTLSDGFITFSLLDDLYFNTTYLSIDDINAGVVGIARANEVPINQMLIDDVLTDVDGMLTFQYGVLGYYMVDGYGSEANRALKRLTVTTEPFIFEEAEVPAASAFSVYNIGGHEISDTAIIVGLGVFSMIIIYYYLKRRR